MAFGKLGDFALNYLKQGTKVALSGRIQTGSYIKDGVKTYTTEVVAERMEFCERKATEETTDDVPPTAPEEFADVTGAVGELPFKTK